MTGEGFILFLALIGLIVVWLFWIRIPAKMARKRGRSALGWVLLTWILSPLWTIILLLILGDSPEKISKDLLQQFRRD